MIFLSELRGVNKHWRGHAGLSILWVFNVQNMSEISIKYDVAFCTNNFMANFILIHAHLLLTTNLCETHIEIYHISKNIPSFKMCREYYLIKIYNS